MHLLDVCSGVNLWPSGLRLPAELLLDIHAHFCGHLQVANVGWMPSSGANIVVLENASDIKAAIVSRPCPSLNTPRMNDAY